ncbi:hypothetical protein BpHYR1_007612 [Brachionus plicatilis]|uniref:Uncharacterized protein n=1 Tax=Brachionus plicatilis TaxID=10195 RepID=A0A3M7QSZ3_BRAPC|nr:hypothetical protein BpHYR1_007612 [Brachionus plicatilis]
MQLLLLNSFSVYNICQNLHSLYIITDAKTISQPMCKAKLIAYTRKKTILEFHQHVFPSQNEILTTEVCKT